MVSRASRVSLVHRGNQVYKRFISQVETLQKENGLPIYHALLKTKDPSESFLGTYKLVATKAIHMFEYRKSNVSSKLKSHTADYATKTKVIDNIPADFLSPPYSNYLFPEGRVILDWVPFRFLQTNIPLLKGRNTVFISDVAHAVETKSEKENSETDTHQETPVADNMQGLLSACTLIRTHHCFDVCCIVDMFGNDIRSLSDHIIVHLQRIHDTDLENINLIIVTSKGACESCLLDKIIEPFEIERVTSGPRKEYCTEQHVYEKEIE
ncbi:uncharacterized protein LOC123555500 [Mercenaria mercenaria]|uniref:uncharacterized protein LOC123555500 n=1 Tax=Mercenaria mercenaria TaxID=6596 RepID=UPI00234FA230|nr:uncharacterized protein LOC123555500 [Mercenaria mercenaria]